MELNTQGVDKPDDLNVGGDRPVPGRYHLVVKTVDDQKRPGQLGVRFEVLKGTVPGQEKKEFWSSFKTDADWAVPIVTRLAMVTGLIGPNEQKNVNFYDAVGRQLVAEVHERAWKNEESGKSGTVTEIKGANMWQLGHEDIKDVPVDQEMANYYQTTILPMTGQGQPAGPDKKPAPPAEAAAGNQSPAEETQPAASQGGWGDL